MKLGIQTVRPIGGQCRNLRYDHYAKLKKRDMCDGCGMRRVIEEVRAQELGNKKIVFLLCASCRDKVVEY